MTSVTTNLEIFGHCELKYGIMKRILLSYVTVHYGKQAIPSIDFQIRN